MSLRALVTSGRRVARAARAPRLRAARCRAATRRGRRRRRRSRGRVAAAAVDEPRASRPSSIRSTSATKIVWSPAGSSCAPRIRASQRAGEQGPRAPSRASTPSQSAIGGTLRAKCWASAAWSPASRLSATRPRRGQLVGLRLEPIATETSGGSSDTDASEPTVTPKGLRTVSTATRRGSGASQTSSPSARADSRPRLMERPADRGREVVALQGLEREIRDSGSATCAPSSVGSAVLRRRRGCAARRSR